MPGFLLTQTSDVACAHQGKATPMVGNQKVLLAGNPTVMKAMPYVVSACTLPPPAAANGPCVVGNWQTGTSRVTSFGMPLAFQESPGTCIPTGTPMTARSTQTRVVAT